MTTQPLVNIDAKLLSKGREVLMLAGLASKAIEAQVVRWREELKVQIDWFFQGGRALVVCMPEDYDRVARHIHTFGVQVAPL